MTDAEVKTTTEATQPAAEPQAASEKKDESGPSARQNLDEADRSMALKQWSKAADLYAVALDDLCVLALQPAFCPGRCR